MEVMKLFLNIAVVVSIFFISSCSNDEKKNYEPLILKKNLAEKVTIKGPVRALGPGKWAFALNMINKYRFNLNSDEEQRHMQATFFVLNNKVGTQSAWQNKYISNGSVRSLSSYITPEKNICKIYEYIIIKNGLKNYGVDTACLENNLWTFLE